MPTPEELARQNIDALLTQCGWIIQKRSEINLSAGRGIAITEGLVKGGDEADYLQFAARSKPEWSERAPSDMDRPAAQGSGSESGGERGKACKCMEFHTHSALPVSSR